MRRYPTMGISGNAAMHSLRAHKARELEISLHEAYRHARFMAVAYDDLNALRLAARLHKDFRNAGAKRRRIMARKPWD